jgi:hypothetical protein
MGKESLVNCQHTLCTDGLVQAVKYTLVQVTGLVVHASHDSV